MQIAINELDSHGFARDRKESAIFRADWQLRWEDFTESTANASRIRKIDCTSNISATGPTAPLLVRGTVTLGCTLLHKLAGEEIRSELTSGIHSVE